MVDLKAKWQELFFLKHNSTNLTNKGLETQYSRKMANISSLAPITKYHHINVLYNKNLSLYSSEGAV